MSTVTTRLYDTDFYAWIQSQADALRSGNLASLDLDNLIEEIESMGKSQQRALESRLEILLMHLLKWQFQPAHQGPSWRLTTRQSASLGFQAEVKRGSYNLEPKAPLTCGGEAPAARLEFFTIEEQRARIARLLKKNPSLKAHIPEALEEAYEFAVRLAAGETGIDKTVFPAQCPWRFEQAMNPDFWPSPIG